MNSTTRTFTRIRRISDSCAAGLIMLCLPLSWAAAQERPSPPPSSYSPVVIQEDFATIMQRMVGTRPQVM